MTMISWCFNFLGSTLTCFKPVLSLKTRGRFAASLEQKDESWTRTINGLWCLLTWEENLESHQIFKHTQISARSKANTDRIGWVIIVRTCIVEFIHVLTIMILARYDVSSPYWLWITGNYSMTDYPFFSYIIYLWLWAGEEKCFNNSTKLW